MIHRLTPRSYARIVSALLPIGMLGCTDHVDPAAPPQATALNATVAAAATAPGAVIAVQDALQRLIPSQPENVEAAVLGSAFRQLAAALEQSADPDLTGAITRAGAAIEQYAQTTNADAADVDAIRLALDGAAREVSRKNN